VTSNGASDRNVSRLLQTFISTTTTVAAITAANTISAFIRKRKRKRQQQQQQWQRMISQDFPLGKLKLIANDFVSGARRNQ